MLLWQKRVLSPYWLLLIVAVYRDLRDDSIILEPFHVPPVMVKRGLTGQVYAELVMDEIQWMRRQSGISTLAVSHEGQLPHLEVPGSGINIDVPLRFVRRQLGIPRKRIQGSIYLAGTEYRVNVRYENIRLEEYETIKAESPEDPVFLVGVARTILQEVDPITILKGLTRQEMLSFSKKLKDGAKQKGIATAYVIDAYLFWENEQLEEAFRSCEKALAIDSKLVSALNITGLYHTAQGNYKEAHAIFESISEDPEIALVYSNWGNVFAAEGRFIEAEKKYRKAISLNRNFKIAYYNYGTSLSERGYPALAIEKFKHAIELDPKYAYAYMNWGEALHKLGDYEAAIQKYDQGVQNDYPGDANQKIEEAREDLFDALSAAP